MIYGKFTYPNILIEITDSHRPKILVGERLALGNQNTNSTLTAGGGSYEYAGQTYTENIGYFTIPILIGKSIKFYIRLEEDKWSHSGTILGDEGDLKLEEVWERVE